MIKSITATMAALVIGSMSAGYWMGRSTVPDKVYITSAAPKSSLVIRERVPVYVPVILSAYEKRQVTCMANNAYFEARSQSVSGIIAVTDVVMNRAEHGKPFKTTDCGVVYQKLRGVCQFSWVCQKHGPIKNWILYDKIKYIVENVYVGNIKDMSNGAIYYHADDIDPPFFNNKVETIKIGQHVFFKGEG